VDTHQKADLDLLATDLKYQRRGAAGCLLKKLTEIADQDARVVFLVSTDSARPVYEKFSFVPVQEVLLDLKEYGEVEGRERFTVSTIVDTCF
jgi:predicted acetyltransferase